MDRKNGLTVVIAGLLLASMFAAIYLGFRANDPFAQFRTPDGTIKIPGGELTKEIQTLLFGPKPQPQTTYTVYQQVRSGYPTSEIRGYTYDYPGMSQNIPIVWNVPKPSELFRPVIDAVKYFFSFNWLVGSASAADRFLVLGDGGCTTTAIATDAGCWAAASGGAGGAGVPGNTDRALLDNASGAGLGTMDAAMDVQEWCSANACNGAGTAFTGTINTGNFAVTIGTGGYIQAGTFQAGSSVITMSGNWDTSGGTFTYGTSRIVFAVDASITTPTTNDPTAGQDRLYSVTVNDTATVTFNNHIALAGVLTINTATSGGIAASASRSVYLTGNPDPLVLSVGSNTSWCTDANQVNNITLIFISTSNYNIPAGTYGTAIGDCGLAVDTYNTSTVVVTLQGNINVDQFFLGEDWDGTPNIITLNASVYDITAVPGTLAGNGLFRIFGTPNTSGLIFTTGAMSGGWVTISDGGYISFGSSTSHVVYGVWTNNSNSASWSAGTGTLTFAGTVVQGAAQSIIGTGTDNLFNNLVLTGNPKNFGTDFSTARVTGALTMTMTAGITWTLTSDVVGVNGTLTLRSNIPGTQWNIDTLGGQRSANHVDVQDSFVIGGSVVATLSTNSGNNDGWIFTAGGGGTTLPPPTQPPITGPTPTSTVTASTVSVSVMALGGLAYLAGKYLPVLKHSRFAGRTKISGILIATAGIFIYILFVLNA